MSKAEIKVGLNRRGVAGPLEIQLGMFDFDKPGYMSFLDGENETGSKENPKSKKRIQREFQHGIAQLGRVIQPDGRRMGRAAL